jgi:hypothetical protein
MTLPNNFEPKAIYEDCNITTEQLNSIKGIEKYKQRLIEYSFAMRSYTLFLLMNIIETPDKQQELEKKYWNFFKDHPECNF